jgi:hypothetical protein
MPIFTEAFGIKKAQADVDFVAGFYPMVVNNPRNNSEGCIAPMIQ